MQDPERLLEQGSEFERSLLEGGIAERPSAALTRRMAVGAGLAGALGYTSSAKALMQTWWGKTVVLASVGAGALGAIAVAAQLSAEPEPAGSAAPALVPSTAAPSVPATSDRAKPNQGVSERAGASAPARASEASTPSPAIEPGVETRRRVREVGAPSAKPGRTLAQEIKLLDRVRGLMAQGDRAAAIVELDRYDRRYPEGTLRREARVLRARATQEP